MGERTKGIKRMGGRGKKERETSLREEATSRQREKQKQNTRGRELETDPKNHEGK